jgi:hypothetical protein
MKTLKSVNQEQVSKYLTVQPSQISEYYDLEDVTKDIVSYVKAVKSGAMLCVIDSVSASGMSRVISFKACEKSKQGYNYRQFAFLFKCLGYKETKRYNGKFRVGGCGMDMIFHTNYCNMHAFLRMGIISKKECETLSQKTPVVL